MGGDTESEGSLRSGRRRVEFLSSLRLDLAILQILPGCIRPMMERIEWPLRKAILEREGMRRIQGSSHFLPQLRKNERPELVPN